jgi:hypothetical protein
LGVRRRPPCQEGEVKGCDDFTTFAERARIDLLRTGEDSAACRFTQARVQGVGFAEAAQVMHKVRECGVAGFDADAIRDGKGEACALQQGAQIADFTHGGDAG